MTEKVMHGLMGGSWKRGVCHGQGYRIWALGGNLGDERRAYSHYLLPRQLPTLHRIGVSKRVFNALDAHVWRLVYKWARFSHSNKPTRWVTARYFGKFNPSRQDEWVFGSQETGFYLRKFAWTPIVRHRMVAGTASPDDPDLTDYWNQRRRRSTPSMDTAMRRLLHAQHGRCPLCQGLLLHADREPQSPPEWEQWLTATRKAIRRHAVTAWGAGTPDERVATRLIHAHCHRRLTSKGKDPQHLPAREPPGLA